MKKPRIRLAALLFLMVFALLAPAALAAGESSQVPAQAGNIDLTLNGTAIKLATYNIANNNYVKLRDVAQLLNGTGKQFSVAWNGAGLRIDLTSGAVYLPEGGELAPLAAGTQYGVPNSASVWLDGTPVELTAYTINQNNYFKLRDLGEALDFFVGWSGAAGMVVVNTSTGYVPEPDASRQAAAAKAMLAVMDRDLAQPSYSSNARLVDVDADGIKELIVVDEIGLVQLYYWKDGQLQSAPIGAVAGGWCEWYLCQNTATGELGIEFRGEGGGSFSGGSSFFYYPSRNFSEGLSIGNYIYVDDTFENGSSEPAYYIGGDQVTQAEHDAIRNQHQRLVLLLEDYDEQREDHIAAVRAELTRLAGQ